MKTYSVGGVAEHLTMKTGTYLTPAQVYVAVNRMVSAGDLPDRRAGGRHVLFDNEIQAIATQLGVPLAVEAGTR